MSARVMKFPARGLVDPREVAARAVLSAIRARGADRTDAGIREAESQVLALIAWINSSDSDLVHDEDIDRVGDIVRDFERFIACTPARSTHGVAAKLRRLADLSGVAELPDSDCEPHLIATALETLDAMDGKEDTA